MSVFSKMLIERWMLLYQAKHRKKFPRNITLNITDVLTFFINHKYDLGTDVLYCSSISTLDYVTEEAMYLTCVNKDIIKLADWINNNLIITALTDNCKTRDVKLRIAVDMLNKLEYSKTINKDISLFYYCNIISNTLNLWHDVKFDRTNDELPF